MQSTLNIIYNGLPGWLSGKESTCQLIQAGDVGWSLDQKDPWEEEMAPHSSILIWKTHGQRSLVGIQSMGVTKSWTRLSN